MSKALATKNVATVLVALSLVFGFAFAFAAPAKADTISDLQAQVQALLAQISAMQGSTTMSASCHTFTQNLKKGSTGGEVMWVQQFLNGHGFQVSASGAGSPGNETSFFGAATMAAVIKFQNANAADILTPVGLTAGTGNWFASTRAKVNAICAGSTTTGGGTVTPTGPGVTVGAASQPANSLAPQGASRVPFTTFTLTNNSSAAVTINNVTVQRTGLGADAVFAGIILVDETGAQLGNSHTLNSNHQANVGDPFILNPGQTKTITVAGNMAASLSAYSGQVVSLSVIGINTTAPVSGSLPITGAQQTINATLALGALQAGLGSSDLNAAQSNQSIGQAGLTGASIRLTAGSNEDVWVKSIRWNQSGSAASSDLANVVTVVDGTSYPTVVDATGKYYSTVFPGNGIQVKEGLNKEMIVRFDVNNGANRTVEFDIYKNTDIYAVGATYGYGVTANPTSNTYLSTDSHITGGASGFITSDGAAITTSSTNSIGTPFFHGSTFTVSAGQFTSLGRATEVPAQNITTGSPNQPLGGFAMNVLGQPIQVQNMTFYVASTSAGTTDTLTSVSLVDQNGMVVAGPVDATASTNSDGYNKVSFTDTVTFPTGRHVFTLKGQVPTTVSNGATFTAATRPSRDWSNVTGESTGDTVSLSGLSSTVTGNTMTVRSGAVTLSVNATPSSQTIVAGVSQQTVGQITFDASQSGEDVKFTAAQFKYTKDATATNVTNCYAYSGTTQLNNTAINPSGSTLAVLYTFTFNTPFTATKGTVSNVTIKCDVPGSLTSGNFSWGIVAMAGAGAETGSISGTGLTSSQTVYALANANDGQTSNKMTLTTGGALTVALDASSPSYSIAAGGSTGVTLGVLRFSGTNEDMRLDRVALQMSNSSASSSPGNLTQVYLYDGATQVGTAVFAGTRFATSTISGTVVVPANSYKILTVKGDLAAISSSGAGTEGALIQIDYDNGDSTGTRGIGQSSGTTINRTSTSDSAVAGVRVFKSYPTITKLNPTTTTLVAQSGIELYRFSVTANSSGDVGLYQVTTNIATSTDSTTVGSTTVANLKLYAFTDSGLSQGVSGFTSGLVSCLSGSSCAAGGVANGNNSLVVNQSSQTKLEVPQGQTYYFKVVGDVAQTGTASGTRTGSVTTKLSGDSDYPSLAAAALMGTASGVASNFVWSPNATTTSITNVVDWTNGYGVVGLPSGGTDSTTLTK